MGTSLKYSKELLIGHYILLRQKLGHQPTRDEWDSDINTPSSKPVRNLFGNWGNFVKACGDGSVSDFVKAGEKKCNVCGEIKGVEEFYKQDERYMYCCKQCAQDIQSIRASKKMGVISDYNTHRQRWDIKRIWEHKYIEMRQRVNGDYGKIVGSTGKGLLSEEEWNEWCTETIDVFLSLWGQWMKSDFDRRLAPSIDRIDNTGGYTKDNIQWLTMDDNIKKYHQEETKKKGKIIVEKDGKIWRFGSPKEAYTTLGLPQSKVSQVLNGHRKTTGGYRLYYQK